MATIEEKRIQLKKLQPKKLQAKKAQAQAQEITSPNDMPVIDSALPEGGITDYVTEPVQAIAGGLAGLVGSGLMGTVATTVEGLKYVGQNYLGLEMVEEADFKNATRFMQDMQEKFSKYNAPETERGQAGLETVGNVMGAIDKYAVKPVEGAIAVGADVLLNPNAQFEQVAIEGSPLTTTQVRRGEEDRYKDIFTDVQETGLPKYVGGKVTDEFGAGAGTVADIATAAGEMLLGGALGKGVKNKFSSKKIQTEALDEAIKAHRAGGDNTTVGTKLIEGKVDKFADKSIPPKIVDYKPEIEALDLGFSEGLLNNINTANKATRQSLNEMLELVKKGKNSDNFKALNPPAKIVGRSIEDRLKILLVANKKSGQGLNEAAKNMKGKYIDFDSAKSSFYDDLAESGIEIKTITGKGGKPDRRVLDLSQSIFRKRGKHKQLLDELFERVESFKGDAYDAHKLKRLAQNIFEEGKSEKTVKGSQKIIGNFSSNINEQLRNLSTDYKNQNEIYAETIGMIKEIDKRGGSSLKLDMKNLDNALGGIARRITSNAPSANALANMVDDLDVMAKKYGYKKDENLLTLINSADEFESFLDAGKRATLASEVAKGINASDALDIASGSPMALARAAEKLKGKKTLSQLRIEKNKSLKIKMDAVEYLLKNKK